MSPRVALVTGGARGIGRAIALDLARRGWQVAVGYRTSAGAAAETRAAIEAAGGRGLALAGDVGDPEVVLRLGREVEAAFGRIDALVHAAGPFRRAALFEETPEAWRATFDANLHSLYDLARVVVPGMRARRWGRIVAFGLAGAERRAAPPAVLAYHVAKVGVLALVRALARALAADGITVNAISPGFVDSGGTRAAELEAMRPRIPAGRLGSVDDAVAAAGFLLSEEAGYVTGTDFVVSGGWGL
ncbi:MAG: 3-oxoacyl-ACP reductase [Candidatus Rokuibacteriota bacterium]|nr:MAG: 3-oxoacyl-ACP reductase [Candidatus Rokubacteria bacterium]